jgi:NitT/TauT family transport system permease protein
MWTIRGPLSPAQYWLFALLGLLAPLALWWFAASGEGVDKVFLPGPPDVFHRLLSGTPRTT